MHPEIQILIDMALADGEITEKKRAIILRKAVALGLDQDEVEMILDGQIALHKMSNAHPVQSTDQTNSKVGTARKCPACGSETKSFAVRCTDCGHEFNSDYVNSSIQKLFNLLRNSSSVKEKEELIRNFPVPNTKEAILEFLAQGIPAAKADKQSGMDKAGRILKGYFTLGVSELMNNSNKNESQALAPAWRAKCEQIIIKARFSMKDDPNTLAEIEMYSKQLGLS
jgi:hypothetical protein